MSRYNLSEAYAELYSNKLNEDIDDNLRFIDYMQDEDIQEVVESLYWEFRDYGYTSDGAFDVLKEAASDEVLTESVDYLCEGRVSPKQKETRVDDNARRKRQAAATTADKKRNLRHSERQARVANVVNKFRDIVGKVKNFGTNAVNKAKSYGAGAATAAQLLPGAAATAGKARLTNLLRTGARLAVNSIPSGANVAIANYAGRNKLVQGRTGKPLSGNSIAPKLNVSKDVSKKLPIYKSVVKDIPNIPKRAAKNVIGKVKGTAKGLIGKIAGGVSKVAGRVASSSGNLADRLSEEQYELLAQYILEDLIQGGYANDYDSALIILNNLSEETVGELALNYLED